jgi:hypothetical protein
MIKIENIKDNDDGSCDIKFDMDYDELVAFAKIGLLKVLTDAANETLHPSPRKLDVPCNSIHPNVMCDGCDCWKSAREYSS